MHMKNLKLLTNSISDFLYTVELLYNEIVFAAKKISQ